MIYLKTDRPKSAGRNRPFSIVLARGRPAGRVEVYFRTNYLQKHATRTKSTRSVHLPNSCLLRAKIPLESRIFTEFLVSISR